MNRPGVCVACGELGGLGQPGISCMGAAVLACELAQHYKALATNPTGPGFPRPFPCLPSVKPEGAAFNGTATGEVRFTVVSPPPLGQREERRSTVVMPLVAQVIPTPPRCDLRGPPCREQLSGWLSWETRCLSAAGRSCCWAAFLLLVKAPPRS